MLSVDRQAAPCELLIQSAVVWGFEAGRVLGCWDEACGCVVGFTASSVLEPGTPTASGSAADFAGMSVID
jgi:hypothetical protein